MNWNLIKQQHKEARQAFLESIYMTEDDVLIDTHKQEFFLYDYNQRQRRVYMPEMYKSYKFYYKATKTDQTKNRTLEDMRP